LNIQVQAEQRYYYPILYQGNLNENIFTFFTNA
jgi:hypothetical protein